MTHTELVNSIMAATNVVGLFERTFTKGDLARLSVADLARLLAHYDVIRNAQYAAQRILDHNTPKSNR